MRLYFEKRKTSSKKVLLFVPVLSLVISLVLTSFLLLAFGVSPIATFSAMFRGAFGSSRNFAETLVKAVPLMLTGLGVSIAFRLRFWNIGAEGQLVLGGVAATWVALFASPYIPSLLLLPSVLLAGALAGAAWAGVPALLKTRLQVDETLTTLMLNYVAILIAEGLFYGAWRDPGGMGFPGTARFPEAAWLPRLYGRVHYGLIFALILAVVLWFFIYRTKWGFELHMIGKNRTAAHYLGVNIKRTILISILISGAFSGLAGAAEVAGLARRLQEGLIQGYGYTAIIVAWMAQLNPFASIAAALLMAALLVGGDQVQMMMRLPSAVGLVMQGMILFPLLAGSLFSEYRLRMSRTPKEDTP